MEVRRRTGGRSARVREAALRAALEALTEADTRATTMNDIARRAGVHASSLIRRWGTAEALTLDALLTLSLDLLPIPDTGSLRDDLTAFSNSLAVYLSSQQGAALARVMATVDDDSTMAEARTRFWQSRFGEARVIIDRAVERGEVAAETDARAVLEALIAPLHFRHLLTHQPIDDEVIARTVDIVLHGVAEQH